ncbi:MAG: hypothetical protein K0U38_11075 [Epsilonproteobacteria bacterium]|nr:hypothetical protein [Campylobacterota bacterium]
MKQILLLLLLTSLLFSSNLSKLYTYYEKQEYKKGCDYGAKYYTKNIKNEKYLTLYALACVETDKINRIAKPMLQLTKSKESRENASYFSTILLQKQLLKQALLDNKSLGDLKLPKTNFVLSKIFNLFVNKEYTLHEGVYTLEDREKPNRYYKVYIENVKKNQNYMIIDIYQDDKFTKRYRYN